MPAVFDVTVSVTPLLCPGVNARVEALRVAVTLGSEAEAVSTMLPLSPRLFSVMVDALLVPTGVVMLVGFDEIVKSLVIMRGSDSFLVIPPPVPVIVSV